MIISDLGLSVELAGPNQIDLERPIDRHALCQSGGAAISSKMSEYEAVEIHHRQEHATHHTILECIHVRRFERLT